MKLDGPKEGDFIKSHSITFDESEDLQLPAGAIFWNGEARRKYKTLRGLPPEVKIVMMLSTSGIHATLTMIRMKD